MVQKMDKTNSHNVKLIDSKLYYRKPESNLLIHSLQVAEINLKRTLSTMKGMFLIRLVHFFPGRQSHSKRTEVKRTMPITTSVTVSYGGQRERTGPSLMKIFQIHQYTHQTLNLNQKNLNLTCLKRPR